MSDIDTDACIDAWDHAAPFAAAAAAPFGGLASATAEVGMHGLGHLHCNEMIGPPAPYVDAKVGYDPSTDTAPSFDPDHLDHNAIDTSVHDGGGGFDYGAAGPDSGGGFDYAAAAAGGGSDAGSDDGGSSE